METQPLRYQSGLSKWLVVGLFVWALVTCVSYLVGYVTATARAIGALWSSYQDFKQNERVMSKAIEAGDLDALLTVQTPPNWLEGNSFWLISTLPGNLSGAVLWLGISAVVAFLFWRFWVVGSYVASVRIGLRWIVILAGFAFVISFPVALWNFIDHLPDVVRTQPLLNGVERTSINFGLFWLLVTGLLASLSSPAAVIALFAYLLRQALRPAKGTDQLASTGKKPPN